MASNAFTNQIPLYPGQPIERLTANTYLKLNSPAIKIPAFQPKPTPPPGATNTSYMFGLFPETTPANSKMDIAPTDFIAQPRDGYGMKVQKYFSNRE